MNTDNSHYRPEFDSFKGVLLDIARQRTVRGVLETYVQAMNQRSHVSRACVWLREENPEPLEGSTQEFHLRLTATAGKTESTPDQWLHAWGSYQDVPLEEPFVGKVALTGERVNSQAPGDWERPVWAVENDIQAFGCTPIRYKEELLGVIGVFLNMPISKETHREGMVWQQIFSDHLAAAIANAQAFEEIKRLHHQTALENEYLKEEFSKVSSFGEIVGRSQPLLRVLEQVELVAATNTNALILGESGTGKELIARAIHQNSHRKSKPFIRVNCASIPRELFESEFFGHVKGAFTSAVKDRAGRFELADGGTLFLDEVGEIPLELQAKLLRVLQDKSFERVGDEKTRKADVRIIAATNRDLSREVHGGSFREDLYFRLSVFPIEMPPLRQRKEDIQMLAEHFIHQKCPSIGCRTKLHLTKEQLKTLETYDWPGNVRELQNVIERAIIAGRGHDLQFNFHNDAHFSRQQCITEYASEEQLINSGEIITEERWKEFERKNIHRALAASSWKIQGQGGAAELLGIKPTTLRSRIEALSIIKPIQTVSVESAA